MKKIKIIVGDVTIPATLNDTLAAKKIRKKTSVSCDLP